MPRNSTDETNQFPRSISRKPEIVENDADREKDNPPLEFPDQNETPRNIPEKAIRNLR